MSDPKERTNYERVCVDRTASWCRMGHCGELGLADKDGFCEGCADFLAEEEEKEAKVPPEVKAKRWIARATQLGDVILLDEPSVKMYSIARIAGIEVPCSGLLLNEANVTLTPNQGRRALILWLEEEL